MQPFVSAKQAVMPDADANRMAELMAKINGPAIKAAGPPAGALAGMNGAVGPNVKAPGPLLSDAQTDAMKKARTELERFSTTLKDKVRSPVEEFGDTIKKGMEAFKAGLIDDKQLAGLEKFARKEAGVESPGARFASAYQVGTTDYVSTINKAIYDTGRPEQNAAKSAAEREKTNQALATVLGQLRDLLRDQARGGKTAPAPAPQHP